MKAFKIALASGRFDAPDRAWSAEFERLTKDESIALVLFTECNARDVADLVPSGWLVRHVRVGRGTGECAAAYRVDRVQPYGTTRVVPVTTARPRLRRSRFSAPTYALVQSWLPIGSVAKFTTVVAHLPAHVETEIRAGRRRVEAVRLHRQTRAALSLTARAMAFHGQAVGVFADWNLNARRSWVRKLLTRAFPGFELSATRTGTHGKRAIDFALSTPGLLGRPTQRRGVASDHKSVVWPLTLGGRKK